MDTLGVPVEPPRQARRRGRSRSNPDINRRRGMGSGGSRRRSLQEDHFPVDNHEAYYGPKRRAWHTRPRSPGLKWHKKYTHASIKSGRVFVVDYVRQDPTKKDYRKVVAEEIGDLEGLRRLYDNPKRREDSVLRVFHVQNADWAVEYLVKKFNLGKHDELVGSDFGKYVTWKHPMRRGGKPLMSGKSWPAQHDPWRRISKTAFGLDYLKLYSVQDPEQYDLENVDGKMMELNCYDEETEAPKYGYDVFAQRMSVYVQRRESSAQVPNLPDIDNPYDDGGRSKGKESDYFPILNSLDNGSTIIIFENSKSDSIKDTLIAARGKWESKWRRLPFYLAYESHDIQDDDQLGLLCGRTILSDVWRAISEEWSILMSKANFHVEILESKIYERPADESRADEIWTNSSAWLRCERLAYVHQDLIREVMAQLRELSEEGAVDQWLDTNLPDFDRVINLVQEDLIKPTDSLSDLMYKSVEIRDSRHSLELSYSMWRLSWITFIFLPLTFTVSFFGMNVHVFQPQPGVPGLQWFFIVAAPIMTVVFASWFILKHTLVQGRQTPYQRGIYERLFHDLATAHPTLWTRTGPVSTVVPRRRDERLKWWLVRRWNDPEKTIRSTKKVEADQFDGLSTWNRWKRVLTRRWTSEIAESEPDPAAGPGAYENAEIKGEGIDQGLEMINQALNLPPTEEYVPSYRGAGERGRLRVPYLTGLGNVAAHEQQISPLSAGAPAFRFSRRSDGSTPRSSTDGRRRPISQGSSRNSDLMVEEEAADWLREKEKEERVVEDHGRGGGGGGGSGESSTVVQQESGDSRSGGSKSPPARSPPLGAPIEAPGLGSGRPSSSGNGGGRHRASSSGGGGAADSPSMFAGTVGFPGAPQVEYVRRGDSPSQGRSQSRPSPRRSGESARRSHEVTREPDEEPRPDPSRAMRGSAS